MAYDADRHVMLLFGGFFLDEAAGTYWVMDDTWEWDGVTWSQMIPAGDVPPARAGAAVAFDAPRGRIVMIGGTSLGDRLSDTWEWDGSGWSYVAEGPACSMGNMAVYDRRLSHVTLLCTEGPDVKGTWSWDGSGWSLLTSEGPPLLNGFNAAYDGAGQVVLLFGGTAPGSVDSGETWTFDGSVWTQAAGGGPTPRAGATMAWDDDAGMVVLFGGATYRGSTFSDTWTWHDSAWWPVEATGPTGREAHALAYDSARRRVVLFGGAPDPWTAPDVKEYGDTWELFYVGSTCAGDTECTSGICADGVCCEAHCGTCQQCDAAGHEGLCTAVTNGDDPDSCTGASTCDSGGVCTVKPGHTCAEVPEGTACACSGGDAGQCLSGSCVCPQVDGGGDSADGAPTPRACDCRLGGRNGTLRAWFLAAFLLARRRWRGPREHVTNP